MAYNDSRGSLWNKWDLHVHTPGTKKNDQYKYEEGDKWDLFCQKIHDSDVMVIGICDYFSVDNYFAFIDKYMEKYPDSCMLFLPNIEVCTGDVVNRAQEEVNVHLVFDPSIPELQDKLNEFLGSLKTNKTNAAGRNVLASELSSTIEYEEATTTREYIKSAFESTFGSKVDTDNNMLIITAANNDGMRTDTEEFDGKPKVKRRKAVITDELDKFSHAVFGNKGNIVYFSNEDRLETEETIAPKPVLAGSDAHSFDDLDKFLGKQFIDASGNEAKQVTWIKADLSFEGLKQILYEPIHGERYSLGVVRPDHKSPDRVIRKITFADTNDLPKEIYFNDNLSAIIGSRSAGKSALLAYIAYVVDSELALRLKPDGPAAKYSWDGITFEIAVEWGNKLTQQGKVVYIPQNFLYDLSRNPEEITQMIKPVLFEKYPGIQQTYEKAQNDIHNSFNRSITQYVRSWFTTKETLASLKNDINDVGDKNAIANVIISYEEKIEKLKVEASLSDEDVKSYKELSQSLHSSRVKLKTIEQDQAKIQKFVIAKKGSEEISAIDFTADISFEPSIESLPFELQQEILKKTPEWSDYVIETLKKMILHFFNDLKKQHDSLTTNIDTLLSDNAELITRCKQNEKLQDLIEQLDKQKAKIVEIKTLDDRVTIENANLENLAEKIKTNIASRQEVIADLLKEFKKINQSEETIQFNIKVDFGLEEYEALSGKFNRKEKSEFIEDSSRLLIKSIRDEPNKFLESIYYKRQKVLYDQDSIECAIDALVFLEDIRFCAMMENDTIGGFAKSSMTEGKQALFALTLLLSRDSDSWPLLIDQPEDDLDSRSIYDIIVPYLKTQKKNRQIIMVSHNANLVVGSDSEQIIVANQHGDDRKNENNQKLDYISGAIEFSRERDDDCETILKSRGIREHACDILDGGKSAFEKRKHKYNL